jgi:hypothetical protein
MICAVCEASTSTNLCDECAIELDRPIPFVPEQVLSVAVRPQPAFLVDVWGRVHPLEQRTAIGRQPSARGLSILHASVSRRHAELRADEAGWTIHDLESSNGTRVDDAEVSTARLVPGNRVCFGAVAFYFVEDDGHRVALDASQVEARTLRSADAAKVPAAVLDVGDATHGGLARVEARLVEAPAGGGGYFELAGRRIQLSMTQYAMLVMLRDRMVEQHAISSLVRGFVPSGQLIADLPWEAVNPDENNLKQLVRRTRRALDAMQLGGLIESRRGFGYRLRVVPIEPEPEL